MLAAVALGERCTSSADQGAAGRALTWDRFGLVGDVLGDVRPQARWEPVERSIRRSGAVPGWLMPEEFELEVPINIDVLESGTCRSFDMGSPRSRRSMSVILRLRRGMS